MAPALAVLVLCAGCTLPPRPPPAAPVPVPERWRTELPGASGGVDAAWWQGFGDPALSAWVAQAVARNTDVATAAARVREARAQERVTRAQQWPTLDAGVTAGRARTLNAFGRATEATTRQPALQAAYELDLFGRIDDLVAGAAATAEAAEAARGAASLSVAGATASGYIALRVLDARLAILQDTLASRAESRRVAGRRAEVGYTSDLELRQAEAEYEATAQLMPQVQAAIARQEHALSLLAGQPPGDVPRGQALGQLTPPAAPGGLPADLLRRRPDIAQAEAALAASDASLAAARAQFLPQVRLTASAGRFTTSALADPVTLWSVGASVLAPLFSAGRLQGQYDAADARREQAALAYRRTVLAAMRDVEDSLSALQHLQAQRARLEAQRDAVRDALRHADNRYKSGYSSYLEQLDAQRTLLSTELSLAQVVGDQLTATVSLQQALGGGWEPPAR